mgnify:CR=1 FL=1
MVMALQQQDRLHYAEVYASDILELKNFFLQQFGLNMINENFGIPFLLSKKENRIVAFASLTVNKDHQIGFEIYGNSEVGEIEKEDFKAKAIHYCKENRSENFTDPDELKYNIQRMVNWLNN